MHPVNTEATGKFRAPRAVAFERLATLEEALKLTRGTMLEDLKASKLAVAFETDFDEKFLVHLQAMLDRVSSLGRRCLEIEEQRRLLLGND